MEICVAAAIFFAALVCFKVCLAQDLEPVKLSPREATIWISGRQPEYFSMTPERSAAVISSNLILTFEELPAANPTSIDYAAVFFSIEFSASNKFGYFHQLTKITVPTLITDAVLPKLTIYKVAPEVLGSDAAYFKIRSSKTLGNESCTITVWRKDTMLSGKRTTLKSECTVPSNNTFCVKLALGDTELKPFGGGLVECNGELAGLYSPAIAPAERLERSYLDLAPFKERIEKIIAENTEAGTSSVRTSTYATLGFVLMTLVASRTDL